MVICRNVRKLTLKNIFFILLLLCGAAILPTRTAAQNEGIKLTFEVDGVPVAQNLQILFYHNNKEFEAELKNGVLFVPPELAGLRFVDEVRFKSEKYDLRFRYFIPIKYEPDTEWVLGVDNKPFDPVNLSEKVSYDDVDYLQHLKGRSKQKPELYWFYLIPVRRDK